MTVKHMVKGIPDRDVAFYIKEKDPGTVLEVCTLYERFNALNSDEPPRKPAVRGVKGPDTDTSSTSDQVTQQQLAAALAQAAETTNRQIQQLADAVGRLGQSQPSPPPQPAAYDAPPASAAHTYQPAQSRYDTQSRYTPPSRQHKLTPPTCHASRVHAAASRVTGPETARCIPPRAMLVSAVASQATAAATASRI